MPGKHQAIFCAVSLAIAGALSIETAAAVPVIETGGAQTTFEHGNQFTIAGSGFGPQANVLYFCSMSGKSDGAYTEGTICEIQQLPIKDGGHNCNDSHHLGNNAPRYDTQITRTPYHSSSAKSVFRHDPNVRYDANVPRSNCYRSAMKFDFDGLRDSVYVTSWLYANVNPFNYPYQNSMSGNFKFWALHDPRITTAAGASRDGVFGISDFGCDPAFADGHYSECNSYMTGDTHPDPALKATDYNEKWARLEQWSKFNSPNSYDGVLNTSSYNERGFEDHDTRGPRWQFDASALGWRDLDSFEYNSPWRGKFPTAFDDAAEECRLDQFPELNGCVNDTDWHFQDMYIAETRARVELCDSATWDSRNHCELQVILPTDSWSSDEITFTLRQGTFADLRDAFIYVVDENGNANTNGFTLYDDRPLPPLNLRAL